MYYEIKDFKNLGDYKLEIFFDNGKKGIVDLKDYIKKGGVFSRFSDIEYFKKAYINKEFGVLCWPDEVDIAPETIYSEATGEPLPHWMVSKNQQNQREVA
jgi:hypothetical protein